MTTATSPVWPVPDSTPRWVFEVRVYVHYFSPEENVELLKRNTRNRNINRATVNKIRQRLREGDNDFSDSMITFAPDGTLSNGQNRLTASVEEGIGIWAVRADSVPMRSQLIMDTSKSRTFAQHLLIAYGEGDSINKASVTSSLWKWENGVYGIRGNFLNVPHADLTDLDRLWLARREEIVGAVTPGRRIAGRTGYTLSALGLAWIVLHGIDADDAAGFFGGLDEQQGLTEGSPILAALRWMRTAERGPGSKPSVEHQLAILFKSWNKYRAGESVSQLRFRPGGANPESFPEPK